MKRLVILSAAIFSLSAHAQVSADKLSIERQVVVAQDGTRVRLLYKHREYPFARPIGKEEGYTLEEINQSLKAVIDFLADPKRAWTIATPTTGILVGVALWSEYAHRQLDTLSEIEIAMNHRRSLEINERKLNLAWQEVSESIQKAGSVQSQEGLQRIDRILKNKGQIYQELLDNRSSLSASRSNVKTLSARYSKECRNLRASKTFTLSMFATLALSLGIEAAIDSFQSGTYADLGSALDFMNGDTASIALNDDSEVLRMKKYIEASLSLLQ